MPVFNNTKILKSGDDIVLGSVISNEQFGFEAYNNLIFDRIEDLVLNYVNDRVKEKFLSFERPDMNINEYREAVLSDIAQKVQEKLNVSISYENEYTAYGVITEAITDSDKFQNFLTVIKERFDEYENSIAYNSVMAATKDQLITRKRYTEMAIDFHTEQNNKGQIKFYSDELELIKKRLKQ